MRHVWIFSILILLFLISSLLVEVNGAIDEKTGIVTYVVDGDTFDISDGDRIRPADIDAPELDQIGGEESKDYLEWLLAKYGNFVYLDEDNLSGPDYWGRLICMVYVDYNLTHYLNVNKKLLVEGYAVEDNYTNNEFDPDEWTLYVLKPLSPTPSSTPTPSPTLTPEPTPTPSPTPNSSPSPSSPSIVFSYPTTIIIGSIIIIALLGILAYYKNYKK